MFLREFSMDIIFQNVFEVVCVITATLLKVRKKCAEQIEEICTNLTIALKMIDASAKFPYTGISYAGRAELGSFDECLAIDHVYQNGRILGKYCFPGITVPNAKSNYYYFGTCIPNECYADDFTSIGRQIYADFPPIFNESSYCTTKETASEYTMGVYVALFLFVAFVFLILASTLFDIYLYKTKRKNHYPVLLAFSVITNVNNLVSPSNDSKERLTVFHGMRTISIAMLIAHHAFRVLMEKGTDFLMNAENTISSQTNKSSAYFYASALAFDTMFFISGFLVAFHYLKERHISIKEQLNSLPKFYIRKYVRSAPAIIMALISLIWVFPRFGNGPVWHGVCEEEKTRCLKYWWSYIFYIQNYVNVDNICIKPYWYLSAEMQLFVTSPLVLIPISNILQKPNGFRLALISLLVLNSLLILIPLVSKHILFVGYKNSYDTHSRLIDYYIGFMMGMFLRYKNTSTFLEFTKRYHSGLNILIWMLVFTAMFLIGYFYQEAELNQGTISSNFFYGLYRPLWCIGLCWIVYSCYLGYGGIVSWFLSLPIFELGAKLSYCMYVLHYFVIGHFMLRIRMKWYSNQYTMFYTWCGFLIETILWALLWTLAFEIPFNAISKSVFDANKMLEVSKPKEVINCIETLNYTKKKSEPEQKTV